MWWLGYDYVVTRMLLCGDLYLTMWWLGIQHAKLYSQINVRVFTYGTGLSLSDENIIEDPRFFFSDKNIIYYTGCCVDVKDIISGARILC